jgi:hypothetical protein
MATKAKPRTSKIAAAKEAISKMPVDWPGEGNLELSGVIDTPGESKAVIAAAKTASQIKRFKIVLEDNENAPPGGVFVGCDGVGYLIQPGMEVEVPESVLNVLDDAIMSVPMVDLGRRVVGYKDRLRFPYRLVQERTGRSARE